MELITRRSEARLDSRGRLSLHARVAVPHRRGRLSLQHFYFGALMQALIQGGAHCIQLLLLQFLLQ